jgi:hypothetical protein
MVCTRSVLAGVLATACAAGSLNAHGQEARLATVLERAAAASDAQKQSLPSFECREDVVSQHVHKGKVDEEGRMVARLRVQKDPTGRLNESFEPVGDPGARGALPFYVTGGFGLALEYVTREHQPCYSYELKGDRLEFRAKPHSEVAVFGCKNPDGIVGEALVDASGDIVHIERHVPARQAERTGFVPFAAIDVGTVELNGREFRMSTHISAVSDEGKTHGAFQATYSNCHLFGATITIHPGEPVDQ